MKRWFAGILVGFVLFGSSADAAATFSRDATRIVPQLMQRYSVPTADVALVQGSTVVWSRAFGTNVSTDLFETASLTKTATALAVLSLVEQKKVALDAPVNTYLRRFKVTSERFDVSKVTVRRLLDHTAGMPVTRPRDVPLSSYPSIVDILNGRTGLPTATPVYAPGTRFVYSNIGYGVLELLIEDVTHKSYPAAMKTLVFDPLFMVSSGFSDDLSLESQVLPPFKRVHRPIGPFLREPRAAGGMLSTEHDVGRLLVGASTTRDLGGLLDRRTLDQMHTVEPAAKGAFGLGRSGGYGLGIATGRLASGRRFFTNSGNETGANAIMFAVPDRASGVVVLTNSTSGIGVELDTTSLWLRELDESLPLLRRLTLARLILRVLGILGLFAVLYELDRLIRQTRRGERRSADRFRTKEIVKGAILVLVGVAVFVVFDSALLTGAFGGIPAARFVSGEFQIVTTLLGIASLVAGVAVAITSRQEPSGV